MPQSARCSLPHPLAAGICIAGVFAGGALSACDVTIKDGDIKNVSVHARASQEWRRQYPLTPGGVVEIANGNGSIEVVSGKPGVVDVTAVVEARAMSETRAKEILSTVKVEESAAPITSVSPRSSRSGAGALAGSNRATRSRSRPTRGWR
jgi:hypothetical protein